MNERQLTFEFPPFARGRETSREAAEEMKPHASRLALQVLRLIRERRGATCAEIESAMGLAHQTASARIWELAGMGLIEDSGARRPTPSGRRAIVWRIRR